MTSSRSYLRRTSGRSAAAAGRARRDTRAGCGPICFPARRISRSRSICVAVHCLGGAAAGAVFSDRRGVVRCRSRGLSGFAGIARSGRLLGVRAGLVFVLCLRLLSARTSAGASICSSSLWLSGSHGCCGCRRRAATLARCISSSCCRCCRSCCCTAPRCSASWWCRLRPWGGILVTVVVADDRHGVLAAARHSAGIGATLRTAGRQWAVGRRSSNSCAACR